MLLAMERMILCWEGRIQATDADKTAMYKLKLFHQCNSNDIHVHKLILVTAT